MPLPKDTLAVIMVGGGKFNAPEQLMLSAWRAATLDLIDSLHQHWPNLTICVATPDIDWLPSTVVVDADPVGMPFHFGQRLHTLLLQYHPGHVLYFGGASAPFMPWDALMNWCDHWQPPNALTNNLHSSDWALFPLTEGALAAIPMVHRDNSLAWLLQHNAGMAFQMLESGLDLDTPADVGLAALASKTGKNLQHCFGDPLLAHLPLAPLRALLKTEAKTLALVGRVSPTVWRLVNENTRLWTRVFAEERGMVGAERVEQGLVRSALKYWIDGVGLPRFFDQLSAMADGVLFDTRVLWAAANLHPAPADRFAADLGLSALIQSPQLRAFAEAASACKVPMLMGGHSVVSVGGVRLLLG
jgi:hypothetical protein